MKSRFATIAVLVLLAGLISWAWVMENPPEVKQQESSFSATRALGSLRGLLAEEVPHPTGSVANDQIRARIAAAFTQVGYVPQEQSAYLCNDANECSEVHNLVITIPGEQEDGAVLLDAHYDSVGAGPGAADNGSGVAIALEIARLLHGGARPKHAVVMLIDDGEEQGLIGSEAFLKTAYARNVRWAVNLDARGVRGPSLMYQTSDPNGGLMKLYQTATHRPVSNSLMSSLYKLLPSATDFTNLSAHGIQGFNLAFLDGTAFYHRDDTLARLDARSVQHQGEEAWALLQALDAGPPASAAQGDAVYFDLFGREVVWSEGLSPWLIALAAGLVGLVFFREELRLRRGDLVRAAVLLLCAVLLTLLLGGVLVWLLYPLLGRAPEFPAHPVPFLFAFLALGAAVSVGLPRWKQAWVLRRACLWVFVAILVCLSAMLQVFLPGAVYLLLVPALLGAAALAGASLWGLDKAGASLLAVTVLLCGAGVLWVPLMRLLYQGEGVVSLPVIALVTALMLLLVQLLAPVPHRPRVWVAGASLVLAAGAAVMAFVLPHYSPAAPAPINLFCLQPKRGSPHWVIVLPEKMHRLVPTVLHAAPFTADREAKALLPWINGPVPLYWAPAELPALPVPGIKVLSRQVAGDGVCLQTEVGGSARFGHVILKFPPELMVRSMSLHGEKIGTIPQTGWKTFSSSLFDGSVDAAFCLAGPAQSEIHVIGATRLLPAQGDFLVRARDQDASASQDGDATDSYESYTLAQLLGTT